MVETPVPVSMTPIFDEAKLESMREVLGSNSLNALLLDIPDETARLFRELHTALGNGDFMAARDSAHTIKGLAGNFAAVRIAKLAGELEEEVRLTGNFSGRLDNLANAIDETRKWLVRSA